MDFRRLAEAHIFGKRVVCGSGASILSAKINQVLIFPKLGRFFLWLTMPIGQGGPPELSVWYDISAPWAGASAATVSTRV